MVLFNNLFRISVISILFYSNALGQTSMTEINNFGSNPGNLKLYFYSPIDSSKISERKPLVIVLHGCWQTAEIVERQSGWNKLADGNGFYVLYPEQLFLNNTASCFNWFNVNDVSKDNGEVLSIRQMISYAVKNYSIDTTQIFIYGLSAGAVMTVSMMVDYPELFNAGASLAGGPFMVSTNPLEGVSMMNNPILKSPDELGALVKNQNPDYKGKYPRLIIIHGEKDFVVNYKNANELIKQWTNVIHIDTIPSMEFDSFQNHVDIKRLSWIDKMKNEIIIFYSFNDMGHSLPVDPGNEKNQGGETGLFASDKNFFSTYYIAKDFGLIKE